MTTPASRLAVGLALTLSLLSTGCPPPDSGRGASVPSPPPASPSAPPVSAPTLGLPWFPWDGAGTHLPLPIPTWPAGLPIPGMGVPFPTIPGVPTGTPSPTPTGSPPGPNAPTGGQPANWAAFEDRVLVLVNERRAAGAVCDGKSYPATGPVAPSDVLRRAARDHSSDMARRGYFSHHSPEGKTPHDRMVAAGWPTNRSTGENIAAGQRTPEDVMTSWMQSPGHCRNIMHASWRHLGVGYYYHDSGSYRAFWTQNFSN